jgi:hypothetical protein
MTQSVSKRLTLFSLSYFFNPEDEGDMFLWNVGSYKVHIAPHPRRRHSSQEIFTQLRISLGYE